MNYLPTLSNDTRRLRILNRIAQAIAKIAEGVDVTVEDGGIYTFKNSIGLITFNYIDITSLQDEEFPAIFIIPEDASSFVNDGDGWAADATWPISIYLNVKTDPGDDARNAYVLNQIETLFHDAAVAVLSDFNLGHAPDTVASIENFVPNPFTDPSFGQAVMPVQVRYTENFFE